MQSQLQILNPKRDARKTEGRAAWFPYYASYSSQFVEAILSSANLSGSALVLDPWNGSGTTTSVATRLGCRSYGVDLNPAMVVVAKARLISKREEPSLRPLALDIIDKTRGPIIPIASDEPLAVWLDARTAALVRALEQAVSTLLVDESRPTLPSYDADGLSDLACFFYTALFRTVRTLFSPFLSSNPTWIKMPPPSDRLHVNKSTILSIFRKAVADMASALKEESSELDEDQDATIRVASSDDLPLSDESVDFILSSPPYCTRLDYAVATRPELALLGYKLTKDFDSLRRRLIGTTTVPHTPPAPSDTWGPTCLALMDQIKHHDSKASATYYYKTHAQYFEAIFTSLGELRRVLKINGRCILVVQDSHYKDIHNDLPQIFTEMAISWGLSIRQRRDFDVSRTLAGVNPAVKPYRRSFSAIESVLCLVRS